MPSPTYMTDAPPFGTASRPRSITLEDIPDGTKGTRITIDRIFESARNAALDWSVISFARELTRAAAPRDFRAMADILFWWVKDNVKFVRDPVVAELVQSPTVTITSGQGDCDDMVGLLGGLLMAVGIPVRLITIAGEGDSGYSHVYLEAETQTGWTAYDASCPGSSPGWFPQRYVRKAIWDMEGGLSESMGDWFSSTWKSIRKEVERAVRRVKEELERVTNRVNEEFSRWENKFGPFGKLLAFGAKMLMTAALVYATAGLILPLVAPMAATAMATCGSLVLNPATAFILAQSFESPWKLNEEEWKLLASIGLAVASIVTAGTTVPLLVTSIASLAKTGWEAYELNGQIEARKRVIDELKAQQNVIDFEERLRREAINKMVADIEAMEWMLTRQSEIALEAAKYRIMREREMSEENARLKAAFEGDIFSYRNELSAQTERIMVDYGSKSSYFYGRDVTGDGAQGTVDQIRAEDQTRQWSDTGFAMAQGQEQVAPSMPVETYRSFAQPWRFARTEFS